MELWGWVAVGLFIGFVIFIALMLQYDFMILKKWRYLLASILTSLLVSAGFMFGIFNIEQAFYSSELKTYQEKAVYYEQLVEDGYELTREDYDDIFELNKEIEIKIEKFYSGFYTVDIFKDFKYIPLPTGNVDVPKNN